MIPYLPVFLFIFLFLFCFEIILPPFYLRYDNCFTARSENLFHTIHFYFDSLVSFSVFVTSLASSFHSNSSFSILFVCLISLFNFIFTSMEPTFTLPHDDLFLAKSRMLKYYFVVFSFFKFFFFVSSVCLSIFHLMPFCFTSCFWFSLLLFYVYFEKLYFQFSPSLKFGSIFFPFSFSLNVNFTLVFFYPYPFFLHLFSSFHDYFYLVFHYLFFFFSSIFVICFAFGFVLLFFFCFVFWLCFFSFLDLSFSLSVILFLFFLLFI